MDDKEILCGTLERFVYKNQENGFSVCIIALADNQLVTAKGTLAHVHEGERVQVTGIWTNHTKFGKQFEVNQCIIQTPNTIVGLKKYLASGLIKGIGPAYADKLVTTFGLAVLEVIDKNPEKLQYIPGIGPKRVDTIIAAWQEQKAISHIMVFLQEKGISPAYAIKIYKRYGQQAISIVTHNPYQLAQDVWGIGFAVADIIASNIGIPFDSIQRVQAGILHIIRTAIDSGHLYVELDHIKEEALTLLKLDTSYAPLLKQALHILYDTKHIALITYLDKHYITQTQYYQIEYTLAKDIKQRLSGSKILLPLDNIYTKLRTYQYNKQALSDDQQRGIMASLSNTLSIVTGGPGTGKTTLIRTLLDILDAHNVLYKLTAPTGRAAKRITESTGKQATTIHRLLEFDASVMKFTRNEKNQLNIDFLIVDESSMIDIFLAHALCKAILPQTHILFLGDIDQLPSVGAGNFLQDLINSNQVPCIRLTHIFRQAQESLIITNAHRINKGEFPFTNTTREKPDYIFIEEKEPQALCDRLRTIYTTIIPQYHIKTENSITLVPLKRGIVGSEALNYHIQDIVNPAEHASENIPRGTSSWRIGDRVMQIRNNYDKGIFNGDIGYIETIDIAQQSLEVRFAEQKIVYESSELDELVLAYAISIHKSQGSEFDAVVVPLYMQHFALLQRNLLYTAITRAKKLCIFVGQPQAIGMAIKNNTHKERCTFLKIFLTDTIQCR